MKALRIKLRQNQASYARGETVTNRMTYPLPPFSTVIGALHNACGYNNYHPMNISIQGKFGSMSKDVFVNHGLLNRREDDRNVLVYMHNPKLLSAGVIVVGEGLKGQGNSFKKNLTVRIDNQELYREYIKLWELNEDFTLENTEIIKPKLAELKDTEKNLKSKLKNLEKKSQEFMELDAIIKENKSEQIKIKNDYDEKVKKLFTIPMSHYKTLVKGPQYQEVLHDVELLIHVHSDEETIEGIKANINNLISLGRSEDFVEILEISEVEIVAPKESHRMKSDYKLYVNLEDIERDMYDDKSYYFVDGDNKKNAKGTVYYLDKDYKIVNNKRIFNKIPCLLSSYIGTDDIGDYTVDNDGYIVNFN